MRHVRLIGINALVLVALLFGLELYYRQIGARGAASFPANGLSLTLRPYVTFGNPPGTDYPAWVNMFTGQVVKSTIRSNNQGYNDPHSFDWNKVYRKGPGEEVVLAVGGSTMWGVGSTSFSATIAGQMQSYLDKAQNGTRYTVVNLGMGSWIAYQQFIGLEMWGAAYDPDWIVMMDGHNDAGVPCSYSQGVTNPLYYPVIKSYIDGYIGSNVTRPVFYRGWLENELIRISAAYRALTGKSYIPNPQIYDETNTDTTRDEFRKVIIPTKVGEARDALLFYVKATEASLALFPQAKYIISTQPSVNTFTGDFTNVYDPSRDEANADAMKKRESDLEVYLKVYEDNWCNTDTFIPAWTYIFVNGAFQLERLAARERQAGRVVEYHNVGRIFPNERDNRLKYFIDPAHLSDEGASEVGKFFASRILEAESAVDVPRHNANSMNATPGPE